MKLKLTLHPPHTYAYYQMEAEGSGWLFGKAVTDGSTVLVPRSCFDEDWYSR